MPQFDKLILGDKFTLTVKQVDAAGNVGIATRVFEKGTVLPPVVYANAQDEGNAVGDFVNVQSSASNGGVFILKEDEPYNTAELIAAAVINHKAAIAPVTAANTDMQITTLGLIPGNYYAIAVDASGRISALGTNPIHIYEAVKPVADFTVIGTLGAVTLINNSRNGGFYKWTFGDGTESMEENPIHVYKEVGPYTITLTVTKMVGEAPNLVLETSVASQEVNIISVDIPQIEANLDVNVYPNPCDGRFNLEVKADNIIGTVSMRIIDINGRIVKVDEFDANDTVFLRNYDISMYSKGVYVIQLVTNAGVQTKRVVVQR